MDMNVLSISLHSSENDVLRFSRSFPLEGEWWRMSCGTGFSSCTKLSLTYKGLFLSQTCFCIWSARSLLTVNLVVHCITFFLIDGRHTAFQNITTWIELLKSTTFLPSRKNSDWLQVLHRAPSRIAYADPKMFQLLSLAVHWICQRT